jgi:DNA-binding XRE family transcriptional regulator
MLRSVLPRLPPDLPSENQSKVYAREYESWAHSGRGKNMVRKRHRAEEIFGKIRAMEVHIAKGLKADEAARKAGIAEQTYYRWRREYDGLKVD